MQALGATEQATDTFTYTVTDGVTPNASSTATLTVTVHGTNDAPVAVADSNAIAEDTLASVSGNVLTNDTDTDTHDTLTVSAASAVLHHGTYGDLQLNTDGSYTYTLNNALPAVQALAAGAHVTDTFAYTAYDGHADSNSANLVITITGTNDAPTATAAVVPNAVEDSAYTFDVSALFSDVDATPTPDTLTYAVSGLPAGLHVDVDGKTIIGTPTDTDVGTYSVVVTADDGHGGQLSRNFTVNVANTNDTPIATADSALVAEDAVFSATGNVLANDADGDANVVQTLTVSQVNGSAGNVNTDVVTALGTFHINTNGSYTYLLNNAAVQSLPVNQTLTDSVTYQVSDGNGGFATTTLTVTIDGANDAPVAFNDTKTQTEDDTGLLSGDVTPNTSDPVGPQTQDFDRDTGETATLMVTAVTPTTTGGSNSLATVTVSGATLVHGRFGDLTINPNGTYSYDLNEAAAQGLRGGTTAQDNFNYQITDGHGGSAGANLQIQITGVNDAPTVGTVIAPQNATEDSPFSLSLSGAFHDVEVESPLAGFPGQQLVYTATLADGVTPLPAWLAFNEITGTFSGTPTDADVGTLSVKVTAAIPAAPAQASRPRRPLPSRSPTPMTRRSP